MLLQAYLQKHFVDKPSFAAVLGISVERLDELIVAGAVPEPTYICDGGTVKSAAFGVSETVESLYGEYFRPECARWAKIADQAAPGNERAAVLAELTKELTENGSNPAPAGVSKSELLQLIDDYASSVMPFSPAEYERSSRKRLVDDLRPLVAKA